MATPADAYFPFDAGAGANSLEANWRKMGDFWLRPGVLRGELNGLIPFGDSSGLQVKVPTGKVWIKGHYGEWTAGVSTLALAAVGAIPGGQSRIDRVIARADFVNNRIELDVLTGTAGASPTAPALTQSSSVWEIPLARMTGITNATTTIAAAGVTLERQLAVAMGSNIRAQKTRTSGNITLAASTAWKNVDTGLDLTLAAEPGDEIEVSLAGAWSNEAVAAVLDVCTLVGGTPVNHFIASGGVGDTPGAWGELTGGAFASITGSVSRVLVAGDISAATVTLRLRARQVAATAKAIQAVAVSPLIFTARNRGPVTTQ